MISITRFFLFVSIIVQLISCSNNELTQKELRMEVKGCEFDEFTDSILYRNVHPYPFNSIRDVVKLNGNQLKVYFLENYNPPQSKELQSGFLVMHFMVNCRGEIGQFQFTGMSPDYNYRYFHPNVLRSFISLLDGLESWHPYKMVGDVKDVQVHLIFKLEEGQLKDIIL